MRAVLIQFLAVVALTMTARANGRPPDTSTINFRQGNNQFIAAGMTFGVIFSKDGGATWQWMCEKAVKYGGMYDPDYAYSPTGALFATTFDGVLVNRDGCKFDLTSMNKKFISAVTLGPDGAVFMAAADVPDGVSSLGDSAIYRSNDNGMTWPVSATPGMINDWWSGLEVAPSNKDRVYLSGFRLNLGVRTHLMFRSSDGGVSYSPIPTNTLVTGENSTIEIVGIKRDNADVVYVRVTVPTGDTGDAIYRSLDAGQTWTKILEKPEPISFVVRANGDLVAGTPGSGSFMSTSASNGDVWTQLVNPPHINCIVENSAGEVWACTKNFGSNTVPSDDAGIMKTTDLVTWTKVLRFQDIQAPVDCPVGTEQRDQCVDDQPSTWCGLRRQLDLASDPTSCPALVDAPPDAVNVNVPKGGGGCCDASAGGPITLASAMLVGVMLVRRRRYTRGKACSRCE